MAMIQGIDGSALLAAFRQGRGDRATDDKAKAEKLRTEQVRGVMGQLFGAPQPSAGVAGNYAPSQPQTPPVAPGATFGEAFSPEVMGAIESGPAPTMAAPVAAAPSRAPNPQALAQLIALDPEMGGKIAAAFKTMGETELKAAEAKNSHMGATAHWLRQFPPQERGQRLQAAAPVLLQQGFTPQELQQAGADLSDQALQHYESHALDFDKLIDNELAEREFQAGKNIPVVPGGNVANIRPDGSAHYVIGGAGQQTGANLPRVTSPEEAHRLPPGSQFIMPDGRVGTVPGGGAGDGAGGFLGP